MGYARGAFKRLISPCRSQWSEVLYSVVGRVGGPLGGCQQDGVLVDVASRAEGRRARAASHGGARQEAELRLARLRVDR